MSSWPITAEHRCREPSRMVGNRSRYFNSGKSRNPEAMEIRVLPVTAVRLNPLLRTRLKLQIALRAATLNRLQRARRDALRSRMLAGSRARASGGSMLWTGKRKRCNGTQRQETAAKEARWNQKVEPTSGGSDGATESTCCNWLPGLGSNQRLPD